MSVVSTSKRRVFSAEFKAEAVQLVVAGSGRPIAQVARELDINESSLGYWVKAYRAQYPASVSGEPGGGPGVVSPVEAARIARLESENRRLAEENAFLKKAAAFFARTQP